MLTFAGHKPDGRGRLYQGGRPAPGSPLSQRGVAGVHGIVGAAGCAAMERSEHFRPHALRSRHHLRLLCTHSMFLNQRRFFCSCGTPPGPVGKAPDHNTAELFQTVMEYNLMEYKIRTAHSHECQSPGT